MGPLTFYFSRNKATVYMMTTEGPLNELFRAGVNSAADVHSSSADADLTLSPIPNTQTPGGQVKNCDRRSQTCRDSVCRSAAKFLLPPPLS